MHYRRKVQKGSRLGHRIGFPTVNCVVGSLRGRLKQGVYACRVRIGKKEYQGAMYFGPKGPGSQKAATLEIHLIGFSGNLYGKCIMFEPLRFIRPPMHFKSVDALKKQIKKDVERIRRIIKP